MSLIVRHHRSIRRLLEESLEPRRLLAAISWDGGGDGTNWSDANNWSTNTLPTIADDVTINVAAAPTINVAGVTAALCNTLDASETVALNNGTLNVAASAIFRAALNWTAGNLIGAGTKTIATGATATLSTGGAKRFDATLINDGTLLYTGTTLELAANNFDAFLINNGTFNINGDGNIGVFWNRPNNALTNNGTFAKNGATTTLVDVAFVNTATLNVGPGGLRFQRGGSTSVPITVTPGNTLDFRSDFTFNVGGNVLGGGGNILFTGGVSTLASASPATLTGITLGGNAWIINSAANATYAGGLTWTQGNLGGSGVKIIPAASIATLTGSFPKRFDGTLRIDGAMTVTNTSLELAANNVAATLRNNGTLNLVDSNIREFWAPAGNVFENAGTLNKTGTATNEIVVPFVNTGSFNLAAGTLQVNDGGSTTTPLPTPAGSTLEFRIGTFTFNAGGNILGGAGTTSVIGGTLNFASASPSTLTNLSVVGNAFLFNSAAAITFQGTLNWTQGYLIGSGVKTIAAGSVANLSGINPRRFDGQLVNNGTMTFTNTALDFSQTNIAAVLTNNGILNLIDSNFARFWSHPGNAFVNAGTLNKTGAAVSIIDIAFNNSSVVNLSAGGLKLSGTGSTTTPLAVPASTSLEITSDFTFNVGGVVLGGAGAIAITAGVTTFASATPATVNQLTLTNASLLNSAAPLSLGGAFVWNGGNLLGTSEKIIPAGGVATFAAAASKRFDTLLRIAGTVNYTGSNLLHAASNSDARLEVDPGGVFNSAGAHDIGQYWVRPNNRIVNNGAFNVSSGAQGFSVFLENNGTLTLTSAAALTVNAHTITGTGTLSVDAGTTLNALDLTQNALNVAGLVNFVALGTGTLQRVKSLSISGAGKIDLQRNALAIDYTGASPLAIHRAHLLTGRAGGTWTGNGLTSSTAAATPKRAVGYGEASQVLGPAGGTFMTRPVDGTTLLFRYTIDGDANLDRTVGFDDLLLLAQNYASTGKTWAQGNMNFDANDAVNFDDLLIVAQNYGTNAAASPARSRTRGPADDLSW